ncbi:MAG: DUF1571 domain-containing protein [Planctomycetota bacterium]
MLPARLIASSCAACLLAAGPVDAQPTTRPIYRVANQEATPAPAQSPADTGARVDPQVTPAAVQAPAVEGSPFDLRQRPGEHPLMPCLRLAKQGIAEMDQNLRGYTATLTKRERISGKLVGPQQMAVKVRQKPFSVHMKFIQPFAGREVLYNSSRRDGKLVALAHDWKRRFGPMPLAPDGSLAMAGQRYPITMTGIYNLTQELVKIAEQDVKFGECTVTYRTDIPIDKRRTTMIEAVHPVPRSNFRFNIARIFIDNEMRIPVAYSAYSWPTTKGGKPILEEEYIYTNLKLNPGLTDADFDEDNPALFRR